MVLLHTFLTSPLSEGEWSVLCPLRRNTGEMSLVGCRVGLDSLERNLVLPARNETYSAVTVMSEVSVLCSCVHCEGDSVYASVGWG